MEQPSNEVTREQASHVHELCYKYVSEKTADAVRLWYEDMSDRCARAAYRLKDTSGSESHHTLILTLLRTCASDPSNVDADGADVVRSMQQRFRSFVAHQFSDCKQVYQQLFVSKSRLLASPIVAGSGNGNDRAKFRVPSCDAFIDNVLRISAVIAIGYMEAYETPQTYERFAHKILRRYTVCVKSILDSSMPAWSESTLHADVRPQTDVQPPHADVQPPQAVVSPQADVPPQAGLLQADVPPQFPPQADVPPQAGLPQTDVPPQAPLTESLNIVAPPLTDTQTQILAAESQAAAASGGERRQLRFDDGFSWD